jgi:FkbM family methyltransferase
VEHSNDNLREKDGQSKKKQNPISIKSLPEFLIKAHLALEHGHLQEAISLIDNNNEAVESVRQLDKKRLDGFFVSYTLATVLHKIGRLSKAEELYKDILEKGLPFAFIYHGLSQICREDGRISEAIVYLEKAIRRFPKEAELWSSFADVLMDSGKNKEEVAVAIQKTRVEGFLAQNEKIIRKQKPEQRCQTIINILKRFQLSGYMLDTNSIAAFFNPEESKCLEKIKEYRYELPSPHRRPEGKSDISEYETEMCAEQMKVNYFDIGLCDGQEMEWAVGSIFPSIGIEDYHAYGFEPCQAFYEKLKSKFDRYDKITLIKKAISDKNGIAKLYYSFQSKEGHSIFDTKYNVSKDKFETVETVLFSDWLKENVPDFAKSFNILRFNIEGAEWRLINDLVKNDLIKNIDVFCGDGDDVQKIGEYKDKKDEYRKTLKKHNIKILPFCSIWPTTREVIKKTIQIELSLKEIEQVSNEPQ